jgi:hypothetical protein
LAARQTICARLAGVVFVALAAATSPAWAETAVPAPAPVTLVQPEALPFSDAELQQALLARLLAPAGRAELPATEVDPAGAGAVTVHVGGRSRVVAVGNRNGVAAARVVALVIAELLTTAAAPPADDDIPAAASPARVAPAPLSAVAVAPDTPVAVIASAAPAPNQRAARQVSVTAGASKGTNNQEDLAGTLDIDLLVPLGHGRLRLVPSAGLALMPTRHAGTVDEVSFDAVAARGLVGASFGPVDVLSGPVFSAYSIGGATPHAGVLLGAEAMARVTAPLSNRLRLLVAARVDGFANRVRVSFADATAYATPRVGIGIGVGLAWEWAS